MKKNRQRTWLLYIPAILLAAFVAAEKSNLLKTDSIATLACTRELFLPKPAPADVIAQNREAIQAGANRYDLPPEMLAAIIYGHQRDLTPKRKFTDCAGSAIGADLSLGLAQIRISTAVGDDGLKFASISNREFKTYRAALLDPQQNIHYQAQELRLSLERDIRYPGITAEELIHDAAAMTLVMSEYRMGRQQKLKDDAKRVGYAFFDLQSLLEKDVYVFGRDVADVSQIQDKVSEYLDYINCDSGIYNASACVGWRKWLAARGE